MPPPSQRAKQNGDKHSIRCRVQNNGYKDAQGTQGELQQHERGHRNHKKEPSEIKAILTEMKNNLQEIKSRVD